VRFDGVRILTFDVVGTLIDFETGILNSLRSVAGAGGVHDAEILESFARAEHIQAGLTPQMPFTQMLAPIYRRMADELGFAASEREADALRESIPQWPAFPDAPEA
jgi:putative hydrolase of the HAD superfamily